MRLTELLLTHKYALCYKILEVKIKPVKRKKKHHGTGETHRESGMVEAGW